MSEVNNFLDLVSKHSSPIKKLMDEVKKNQKLLGTHLILLDFIKVVLSDSKCSPSCPVVDDRMRGVFIFKPEGYPRHFNEDLQGFTIARNFKDEHSHLVCLVSYDTVEMSPSVRAFWLYIFDTLFKDTENLSRRYLGTACEATQLRAGMYILTYCLLTYIVVNKGAWRKRGSLYSNQTLIELHPVSFYQSAPLVLKGIASDCNVTCILPSVYFDDSCLRTYIKDVSQIENKLTYELYRDSFIIYCD